MSRIVTRRGLLGMFAAGAAAAIVKPSSLMPIAPQREIVLRPMPSMNFGDTVVEFERLQIERFDGPAKFAGGMLYIDPRKDGTWRPLGNVSNFEIGLADVREPRGAIRGASLSVTLPDFPRVLFKA